MESQSASQSPPLTERVKTWFDTLPFATRSNPPTHLFEVTFFIRLIFVVCVGLHLAQLLLLWNPAPFVCLSASAVIEQRQLLRLIAHPFIHLGILHIAFNMLTFIPISKRLERDFGTVQFAWVIGVMILVSDVIYILMAYLLATVGLLGFSLRDCGCGFSGILFGLIVIRSYRSESDRFSFFGLFTIPMKIYPWALLLIWQLLMPGISFLGHLSGILVGQMIAWGWLSPAILSAATIEAIERSSCCFCSHRVEFVLSADANSASLPSIQQSTERTSTGRWFSMDRWRGEVTDRFPGRPQFITDPSSSVSRPDVIPVVVEQPDDFSQLVEMGFDGASVRAALLASDGDFTQAMNKLTGAE